MVNDEGTCVIKNNRLTIDDASRQKLTMDEIEALKKADTSSGRDIIKRILEAHSNLDEKTAFSLAKYTLRKVKKYMRRFTVLPLDINTLLQWLASDKDPGRIMEVREETLGLVTAWSNVHFSQTLQINAELDPPLKVGGGRYLVVDEMAGMLVAALADKLDILYADHDETTVSTKDIPEQQTPDVDTSMPDADQVESESNVVDTAHNPNDRQQEPRPRKPRSDDLAERNTLTVIHANAQPNLSLLKYFGYDTNNPDASHPLHTHLRSINWLQLLDPLADTTYAEPATVPDSELSTWKSGRRGDYFRKRRRWARCRTITDDTRAGGFDGLVVASHMNPETVLRHTAPLVRGGGTIVVYSPTVEPLAKLMDCYSRDRKTAYLDELARLQDLKGENGVADNGPDSSNTDHGSMPNVDDFPLDPRLLLNPALYTTRTTPWQVLPGRTHPVMSMRGGAEGYVFCARRVVPVSGKVEARRNRARKRKAVDPAVA